jgi:hypothetical protein
VVVDSTPSVGTRVMLWLPLFDGRSSGGSAGSAPPHQHVKAAV